MKSNAVNFHKLDSDFTATRYGLDGPGTEYQWEDRFSVSVQSPLDAHPAFFTMDTGSFPGVKRPARGADQALPSRAKTAHGLELYRRLPSLLA